MMHNHREYGTVYRGMKLAQSEHAFYTQGKKFLWPGFTSASLDLKTAFAFGSWGGQNGDEVIFEIQLGKGEGTTYSREISHLSCYPSEREVLIYCYSGFEVVDRGTLNGHTWITLRPFDTLWVERGMPGGFIMMFVIFLFEGVFSMTMLWVGLFGFRSLWPLITSLMA